MAYIQHQYLLHIYLNTNKKVLYSKIKKTAYDEARKKWYKTKTSFIICISSVDNSEKSKNIRTKIRLVKLPSRVWNPIKTNEIHQIYFHIRAIRIAKH